MPVIEAPQDQSRIGLRRTKGASVIKRPSHELKRGQPPKFAALTWLTATDLPLTHYCTEGCISHLSGSAAREHRLLTL